MKKAIALLILALLVQPVFAQTYINIYVDSTGQAEFFGETTQTNLTLPQGISVADGKIRGATQTLTSKTGETWTFSYSLPDSEIKAILPEGSTVKSLSNPTAEIFLDRERISVYFIGNLTVKYVIDNTGSNSSLIIWLIVILAVLGIAGYFYHIKIKDLLKPKVIYRKIKPKHNIIDAIRHILHPREQLILDKLKQIGKIKMSHLRKLTEIPKASFSRHIQELERKKLIVRSGEGKNKFVQLAK